jgi:hypothetical protein
MGRTEALAENVSRTAMIGIWHQRLTYLPSRQLRRQSEGMRGSRRAPGGSPVFRHPNALATGVDRSAGEGFAQQIRLCQSLRRRDESGDLGGADEGLGDTRPSRTVVVDDGDQCRGRCNHRAQRSFLRTAEAHLLAPIEFFPQNMIFNHSENRQKSPRKERVATRCLDCHYTISRKNRHFETRWRFLEGARRGPMLFAAVFIYLGFDDI